MQKTFEEGIEAYNRGDYQIACSIIRPLAEDGSPEAQNQLGLM
ncbi:MAG: sel1 repeat family protein, partial [Proteobacteria bacterium]|nr:sel1 repeat family protein [Pseudomonadota bacterium]